MSRRRTAGPRCGPVESAWAALLDHPLLSACGGHLDRVDHGDLGDGAWVLAGPDGWIRYRHERVADEAEWTWMLAHAVLHLALGHTDPSRADAAGLGADVGTRRGTARLPERAYAAACCLAVDRLLVTLRLGRCPYPLVTDPPSHDEKTLAGHWRAHGIPGYAEPIPFFDFLVGDAQTAVRQDFPSRFASALATSASNALGLAKGITLPNCEVPVWQAALDWFVSSFPLLGAVAVGMRVVADAEVARAWNIATAAVDASSYEIYVNPNTRLGPGEWRFVIGHELLHVALRHQDRTGGRDPYIWNVACDYVVNGWLVELGIGESPDGLLYDPALTGMSCEAVYDRIAGDLRRLRRLGTLRGRGLGDMLDGHGPGRRGSAMDVDAYCRHALSMGLSYHLATGRGTVPAGLEEAIWALDSPPPEWDVALARWFDEHVAAVERRRSYARPSRRQTASPRIPRPGWVRPEVLASRGTFGVVLDSSGSMDRILLGKALGAIAAYAVARDVPLIRLVFCDAAAHDAGYLPPAEIAGRVMVKGRGGTVLQPGIDLLEASTDFPADGPILVVTDGKCDRFRVQREHAVLVPAGAALPVRPRGPVMRLR